MPFLNPDYPDGGPMTVPPEKPPNTPPPPKPPATPPPTPPTVPPTVGKLPPLPDPTTWTGGLITQEFARELVEEGYTPQQVSDWQRAIENYLLASGKLTGTPVPVPPLTPPGGPGTPPSGPGGGPVDPSEGDPAGDPGPAPSYDDYSVWQDEQTTVVMGLLDQAAAGHPPPGTVIGTPYQGTHSKASNIAGGSDNWQSENAVDVWLYPGTPIVAIAPGQVSPPGWGFGESATTGRYAGYRLHLVIGGAPWVAFYTHLQSVVVKPGQRVQVGQLLGYSGIANGVPHLHFALQPGFDPAEYVRLAYDLSGKPPAGTPGVPTVPGPAAPIDFAVHQARVEQAYQQLAKVFAYTIPDATQHIKTARGTLSSAVN
jgi:murein DD-endopeptidase MepM/ murein hydrolase activator NlpD